MSPKMPTHFLQDFVECKQTIISSTIEIAMRDRSLRSDKTE